MAENRFPCTGSGSSRETVCIDTQRVLDSCRDRDCFENVRVYLSCYGNEILEHSGAIRAKCAKIVWSYIGIDPIQFNRGFYAITIRFYVKVTFEALDPKTRATRVRASSSARFASRAGP